VSVEAVSLVLVTVFLVPDAAREVRLCADRADVVLEVERVVLEVVGQRVVEPTAATDARFVHAEFEHLLKFRVVPLGFTSDDGVAGQVALGVEVLVMLSRRPPEQSALGDA